MPFEAAIGTDFEHLEVVGIVDLGLKRSWLIYPGRESYSLGNSITAVPAVQALSPPASFTEQR